jgi:hypothetical protein
MTLLYLLFLACACVVLAILWFFVPSLTGWTKVLIAAGVFLVLSIATTVWINWAAQQLPSDAEVILPPKKAD